jgi:tetratricopeptide (TPR) repeat protein
VSRRFAALVSRAESLALAGDWGDEAGAVNAELLRLDPKNVAAHTRLGNWCLHHDRTEDAEKLYRRVIELDPSNLIARNRLGEIVRRRQHERLAANAPTFAEAFRQGVEARRRGKGELAVVFLEKAETLASSDAARIALAAAYRDIQKLDKAEAVYRAILAHGENRAARIGLAGVLRDLGNLPEAKALCRLVLSRYPNDDHAWHTLRAIEADMRVRPYQRRE